MDSWLWVSSPLMAETTSTGLTPGGGAGSREEDSTMLWAWWGGCVKMFNYQTCPTHPQTFDLLAYLRHHSHVDLEHLVREGTRNEVLGKVNLVPLVVLRCVCVHVCVCVCGVCAPKVAHYSRHALTHHLPTCLPTHSTPSPLEYRSPYCISSSHMLSSAPSHTNHTPSRTITLSHTI